MFRCYFCGEISPPKTTRHSVVIETRTKRYSERRRQTRRGSFRDRDSPVQDRGGQGIEITKEVDACPTCASKEHVAVDVTDVDVKSISNVDASTRRDNQRVTESS